MDHSATYDADIFLWSHEQASALRELARTRRDLPNSLDFENIAEEIESLGNSELARVDSLFARALEHAIKLACSIQSDPVRGWRREIRAHLGSARKRFTPGMRQNVHLDQLWLQARRIAEGDLADYGEDILKFPDSCPVSLDRLLDDALSVDDLVEAVQNSAAYDARS